MDRFPDVRLLRADLRQSRLWLALGPALAAILVISTPHPGVWLDEAATVSATSRSWSELHLLTNHQDRSLLGYYAITKSVANLVGVSPLFAGRLVSSLGYVGSTFIISLMAAKLFGPKTAAISGATLAVLPATAAAAVNARPEAISTFLVAFYLFSTLKKWRVAQLASGALACLVYALNILYLPLALLVPLLKRARLTLGDVVTALGASTFGFSWLLTCASQQKQVSWIHSNPLLDFIAAFVRVGVSAPMSSRAEGFVTSVSVVLGCSFFVLFMALCRFSRARVNACVLFGFSSVPPIVATLVVLCGKDIFVERYFTPSSLGLALLAGLTFQVFRGLCFRRLFFPLLAVGCLPSFVSSHAPDGHWGENLGTHYQAVNQAGPEQVFFKSPRNRAVLFASGEISDKWADQSWWKEAKAEGVLWGPTSPVPEAPSVVILGVHEETSRVSLEGCSNATKKVVRRDARFISLQIECRDK